MPESGPLLSVVTVLLDITAMVAAHKVNLKVIPMLEDLAPLGTIALQEVPSLSCVQLELTLTSLHSQAAALVLLDSSVFKEPVRMARPLVLPATTVPLEHSIACNTLVLLAPSILAQTQ